MQRPMFDLFIELIVCVLYSNTLILFVFCFALPVVGTVGTGVVGTGVVGPGVVVSVNKKKILIVRDNS